LLNKHILHCCLRDDKNTIIGYQAFLLSPNKTLAIGAEFALKQGMEESFLATFLCLQSQIKFTVKASNLDLIIDVSGGEELNDKMSEEIYQQLQFTPITDYSPLLYDPLE